jgi:hypothetical protein
MTDRPQPEPSAFDDPTRDIRLSQPPEWSSARQAAEPAPAGPDFTAPPPELPAEVSEAPARPTGRVRVEPMPEEQPTDQLAHGTPRRRERTLAFSSPEMRQRPVGPVKVRAARRWPWVALVVLPLLLIAAAGMALLLVLRG